MNEALEFLSGIKLSKDLCVPEEYAARKTFIEDMVYQHPGNDFVSSFADLIPFKTPRESSREVDIFSMTDTDFKKYYIEGLLNRWGTIRKAAEVLGIPEQTLYSMRRTIKHKLA
jgi:hypothetical protein